MSKIFLYNPENDIALGHAGNMRFTPPRQASLLAHYGAPLMWWMGNAGDMVLIPEVDNQHYAEKCQTWLSLIEKRFGAGPALCMSVSGTSGMQPEPWGWSQYTCGLLADRGVARAQMSWHAERMDGIRQLSHRRSSVWISRNVAERLCGRWGRMIWAGSAIEITDIDRLCACVSSGGIYLKSPWSSSGRGVVDCSSMPMQRVVERCESIIRKQGSAMLEPVHDKVMDFAMLFETDMAGETRYVGMSEFFNERGAAYTGNKVVTDDAIVAHLGEYVPEHMIADLRDAMADVLHGLTAGKYAGCMGVDMMVARDADGACYVVPCVELNLRMTMGFVAHRLRERVGCDGVMRVIAGEKRAATPDALPLIPHNSFFNMEFVES